MFGGIGMYLDRNGIVLPLVLIVMVLIISFGATLFYMSSADLKQVTIEESKIQAHFLARSGAELVANNLSQIKEWEGIDYIITHLPELDDPWQSEIYKIGSDNIEDYLETLLNKSVSLKIELYKDNALESNIKVAIIKSTATVGGISETQTMEWWDDDHKYWR